METHPGAGTPVLEALPEALSTWTTRPSEMADWSTRPTERRGPLTIYCLEHSGRYVRPVVKLIQLPA